MRTVTSSLHSNEGIIDTLEVRSKIGRFATCNGNAKSVRVFPEVAESTVGCLQNKLSTAYPTADHGRPVLLGAVVQQQVQA